MIDVYSWATPNGQKVHIMLEETGLEYQVHPINIRAGDQFRPEFLNISPNNRIPAIIDNDGPDGLPLSLFESGAILFYLAEKTGQLMPTSSGDRYTVMQWLMWQMGGIGPMLGQAHHFRNYATERFDRDKLEYGIERYTNEANRLYGVLDQHLEERNYVAGEYSIADISIWPWMRQSEPQGVDMTKYPHVQAWFERVGARPAVVKGAAVIADLRNTKAPHSDKEWDALYGKAQMSR